MLLTGLDVLVQQSFTPLRNKRVGLITHPAAVDQYGVSAATHFQHAPNLSLEVLFGPEHGITGEAQDLIPVENQTQDAGPRVVSLYGDTFESLKPTPEMLKNLDVLVVDMQDVGSRYYTFQATMLYAMEAAAALGLPVLILDRPNPIGNAVEGPALQPGFESFVGPHNIATRHGLTMGGLAKFYKRERVPQCELQVLACEVEARAPWRWVLPPSPNMPYAETAVVYPGGCLYEGTNLSEGRGTTRPFEYVGFPGADGRQVAEYLQALPLPGVKFIPVQFRPTFQKHAGQQCGGIFQFVKDFEAYQPVRTGLAVLMAFRQLLGERFRWRTETYEFVSHIPAIDLLFGSARERMAMEAGKSWKEITAPWVVEEEAYKKRRH